MDNDNDFTFCQVGPPGNQEDHETNKLTSDIESITIKDGLSNGTSSNENRGVLWQGGLPGGATSKKQEIVGSLCVSVIDASSMKKKSEVPKQLKSGDAGNSVKPATRAKVPFEKGYSQMDWLKLTRTHPDLAGLKGQSNKRLISPKEVKQHQKGDSMWTVLKGRVYNLSPYMRFHPGGVDVLKKAVGKDCTSLFMGRLNQTLPTAHRTGGEQMYYLPTELPVKLVITSRVGLGRNECGIPEIRFTEAPKSPHKYHAWVNAEFLLEKCLVGTLDDGEGQHSKH